MSPVEKDVGRSGVLRSLVASDRLARRRRGHECTNKYERARPFGGGPMSANREERARLTYALDELSDGEAHLEEVFRR